MGGCVERLNKPIQEEKPKKVKLSSYQFFYFNGIFAIDVASKFCREIHLNEEIRDCSVIGVGPDLYIIGGFIEEIISSKVLVANYESNWNKPELELSYIGDMEIARAKAIVLKTDRRLFAIGGEEANGLEVLECETYSFETKLWTPLPTLHYAKHNAILSNNFIYATDRVGFGEYIERLNVFSETEDWQTISICFEPGMLFSDFGVHYHENTLLIFGGQDLMIQEPNKKVFAIEVDTGTTMLATSYIFPCSANLLPWQFINNGNSYSISTNMQLFTFSLSGTGWIGSSIHCDK